MAREASQSARPKKALKRSTVHESSVATEIYFYEYYWDLLTYVGERKKREEAFEATAVDMQWGEDTRLAQWQQHCQRESRYLRRRRSRLKLQQFKMLAQIGKGGYGEVFLARRRDTSEVCAVKRMKKRSLRLSNEIHHIMNERSVLTAANSDWLVRLLYSFQDDRFVYLAMEYVPGGDLRTLMNQNGVLLENQACFYLLEMAFSLSALHSLGFIHRDIKPENFLLDSQGHIKLTDFGLAKGAVTDSYRAMLKDKLAQLKGRKVMRQTANERRRIYQTVKAEDLTRAFSLVGSPDYMAPEILMNEGYDLLADYWSIGCIFYEFLTAFPPFAGKTVDDVLVNVFNWKTALERPVYTGSDVEFNLSDSAWSLISRLIADKEARLHSPRQIQSHPLYSGTDWSAIHTMVPPFVPDLRGEIDTQYFSASADKGPSLLDQIDEEYDGADVDDRALWVGWTFKGKEKSTDLAAHTTAVPGLEPAGKVKAL